MSASIKLNTPVSNLYLVGPTYASRLSKLGINTVEDLLYHFPFRYDDFSLISKIAFLQAGETVTIRGQILSLKNIYTKNGKKIQQAKIADETDSIDIIWFNQLFLINTLKVGEYLSLSGKVDFFGHQLVLYSPEYEIIRNLPASPLARQHDNILDTIHTGRLVPVYPETYGVSSKWLRSRIAPLLPIILPQIVDFLPEEISIKNNLLTLKSALQTIHFPGSKKESEKAIVRLSFDELFLLQLGSLKRKQEWSQETTGHPLKISDHQNSIQKFWEQLPFTLTGAQRKVIQEIFSDLSQKQPMNRLLQGDVGSGKTVVAAVCLYLAYLNGYQSAFMAPTEILANQHYQTIKQLLEPLGLKIGLITATTNKTKTKKPSNHITIKPSDNYDIYIGTHALISEKLHFNKLGLIVIDEQHRFGVEQRAKLKEKGLNPHLLSMTATPIPRTIALTLYKELEMSVIDEMPIGRQRIKTWVVPTEKRNGAYQWIEKQINPPALGQAFIVCPLIEESETLQSVKSAKKEFEHLSIEVFPKLKLGLLHGRLKSKEKEEVLEKFRQNQINILVSTPVVEVGIDIPNSTIILIEAADRFGLAQLHQLRGRVGRSEKLSYCLLFTENNNPSVLNRLKALESLHVGIELAELDLKLRGPGEIFGTRQHGLPNLKIAKLTDLALIEMAKTACEEVLQKDPSLKSSPILLEKLHVQSQKLISPN